MGIQRNKRVLSLLLVGALLSGAVSPALALQPPAEGQVQDSLVNGFSEDPDRYEIYPVPHSAVYPEGASSFTMTKEVNAVIESGVDSSTKEFLEEILAGYGMTMTTSGSVDPSKTNILLGIYGDEDTTVADPTPTSRTDLFEDTDSTGKGKYDPYMLVAETGENENGIVTIVGKDTDCVYYGLATLQMMFTSFAGQKFLPVTIEDYSNVRFRGFIEGFYGGFDYAGRESQMRSIRDVKGNIYVFASKTDPYHSDHWYELYPDEELAQIKHLVEVGEETKVAYTWSVHIGKGGFFNGASTNPDAGAQYEKYLENLAKLEAKFQQLYDVGVRNFHVLNDDYNSGTNADVVVLLNTLNAWCKEKGCGPILYCPKNYNVGWAGGGSELKELAGLDDDIYLYWTGSDVNSPINQSNISFPYEKSGQYPATWLNYPCSEHDKSGIYLGDISHYVSEADGLTGQMGIISNPVNYPEANKVAYFQLLSWGWNRDNYTSYLEELWEDCFKYLQPEVYDSYLTIARNVSNCPESGRIKEGFPESEYLKDKLDSVQTKALAGETLAGDPEVEVLLQEFSHILSAVEDFRANCTNEALVAELDPWLSSLTGITNACKSALEAILALQAGDTNGAWLALSNASLGLDEWDNYPTPQYAEKMAKAGSKRLQPFASKLVPYIKEAIVPVLFPDGGTKDEPTFYGMINGKQLTADAESDKMFDGSDATAASFAGTQLQGDYLGVDLGSVKTVSSVQVLQGADDEDQSYFHDAVLECSADGENWTALTARADSCRIQADGLTIPARYVRMRLTGDGSGDMTRVREFTVTAASQEGTSLVYTNLDSEAGLSVAESGGVYTLSVSQSLTLEPGQYVGIRLPEIMGISDIALDGEIPAGFAVQISTNGAVWTDGAIEDTTTVRYIRLINQSESAYTGELPALSATVSHIQTDLSYVSTNMGLYSGNWSNIVDGDRSSLAWTNAKQTEGQYIIFDMGSSQPVYDVTLYFPESGDYPHYLDISIGDSSDPAGDWTLLKSFDNHPDMEVPYRYYACNGGGQAARYIKLEISKTDSGWIKFNELEVNKKLDQGDPLGAFSGEPKGDFDKTMDGDITTFFAPGEIGAEGGYMQYLISEDPAISSVTIVQSPTSICGAEFSVQTADGNWVPVGTLDQGICTFKTAGLGDLLAIRLDWKAGTSPAIAEIVLQTGGEDVTVPSEDLPLHEAGIYAPVGDTSLEMAVDRGTPEAFVGLPHQAEVETSGGHTVTLPVSWSCPDGYDGTVPGVYSFTGVYELDGTGLTNPGGFELSASVTVRTIPEDPGQPPVTPPTENLALGRPVEVSGYEPGGPQGNKDVVVNGVTDSTDINERWSSNYMKGSGLVDGKQTPSWVTVDLGEDVDGIQSVKAYYHAKVWPTDYVVQFSADGQDWTDAETIQRDNGSLADAPVDELDLTDAQIPDGVRYIRLYFNTVNENAAGHSVGLKELEVYGTREIPGGTVTFEPEVVSADPVTAVGQLGGEFDALQLPETVAVHLKDGSVVSLPVDWQSDGYDNASGEAQTLTGTLDVAALSAYEITNPEQITASLTLTLTGTPEVESVLLNPSGLTVLEGTVFESLELPDQAVLQLDNGYTVTCGLVWNSESYDPQYIGVQTVSGTLVLPEQVNNSLGLTAQMPVTVTSSAPETVTVTFNSNGGSAVTAQTVAYGGTVREPEPPTRSGYRFAGWYSDPGLTRAWDFSWTVTADMSLYAKWDTESSGGSGGSGTTSYGVTVKNVENGRVTSSHSRAAAGVTVTLTVRADEGFRLSGLTVTDQKGAQVKVTDKGAGKYAFTMPASAVTVEASFAAQTPQDQLPFTDVKETDWFYEAVKYAYEQGLMEGTAANTFAPLATTSRGMMVTLLWRLAGEPQVDYAMTFGDVESGSWYTEAVRWAASEQIVGGYSDTVFAPGDAITREQLAAILYRYAEYAQRDTSARGDLSGYTDGAQVSSWARDAVEWAAGTGLLTGKGAGVLDPGGTATRAEVATMLMRFVTAADK